MQSAVVENYSNDPDKMVDLEWLEEELHRINDEANLAWNRSKRCVEHRLSTEEEYQLLFRWSEHVGAALEVSFDNAYIYR